MNKAPPHLAASPAPIIAPVAPCSSVGEDAGSNAQTDAASRPFLLVAAHSRKCVDDTNWSVANGTVAQQWDCNGSQANQQFLVTTLGSGKQVKSAHSGKCLDVGGWSTANGARVLQWDCTGGANQI